jgi:hypothetical protein
MTVTLQIGNSDDKLTQQQWSNFVFEVADALTAFRCQIHYCGGSDASKPWQNYCWVFELDSDPLVIQSFQKQLVTMRARYMQDSVAWTSGTTLFV